MEHKQDIQQPKVIENYQVRTEKHKESQNFDLPTSIKKTKDPTINSVTKSQNPQMEIVDSYNILLKEFINFQNAFKTHLQLLSEDTQDLEKNDSKNYKILEQNMMNIEKDYHIMKDKQLQDENELKILHRENDALKKRLEERNDREKQLEEEISHLKTQNLKMNQDQNNLLKFMQDFQNERHHLISQNDNLNDDLKRSRMDVKKYQCELDEIKEESNYLMKENTQLKQQLNEYQENYIKNELENASIINDYESQISKMNQEIQRWKEIALKNGGISEKNLISILEKESKIEENEKKQIMNEKKDLEIKLHLKMKESQKEMKELLETKEKDNVQYQSKIKIQIDEIYTLKNHNDQLRMDFARLKDEKSYNEEKLKNENLILKNEFDILTKNLEKLKEEREYYINCYTIAENSRITSMKKIEELEIIIDETLHLKDKIILKLEQELKDHKEKSRNDFMNKLFGTPIEKK